MKESHKRTLGTIGDGLIRLLKIIWIVVKSFFEAITWDFYDNIKKYWKKTFKKTATQEPVKPEPKKEPEQPLP